MLPHRIRVLLLFCSLIASSAAAAQQIVDRIVAVVDDEIILQSELKQAVEIELSQRAVAAAEREKLRDKMLDAMIDDKVLLIKAKRDSIVVTDKEINDALQEQLDRIKAGVGSEEEYQKLLALEGTTERELRRRYRSEIRNYLLKQQVMASISNRIFVSYKDVVDFYTTHRDSLPPRPQAVNLSQIYLRFPDHDEDSRRRMSALLERVRGGEDFAQLAREFSEDPGSADAGGDLGFFSPGTMLPEFEKVVLSLQPGEVSNVVRTAAGYHIIKVEEKKSDTTRARHISARVGPRREDFKTVTAELKALRTRALNGEDFSELARKHSLDDASAVKNGLLGWFSVEQLPPAFQQALVSLSVGEISEPILIDSGMSILRLNENESARPLELEKDRDLLENMLRQERLRQAFDKMIASLKQQIYIDVRKD